MLKKIAVNAKTKNLDDLKKNLMGFLREEKNVKIKIFIRGV